MTPLQRLQATRRGVELGWLQGAGYDSSGNRCLQTWLMTAERSYVSGLSWMTLLHLTLLPPQVDREMLHAWELLRTLSGEEYLPAFNETHTREEVLALLDAAIAIEEAKLAGSQVELSA